MRNHRIHRHAVFGMIALTAISLVAASCTNPAPAGGFKATFRATKITNVTFVGDYPTTFWDPDSAEEPYLIHLGLDIQVSPTVSVKTSVSSTYLNNGAYIGKIGSGQSLDIAPGDGLTFTGLQLPDTFDLANGAPFRLLGSVEFLFERDQLIPIGVAQLLGPISDLINVALPPILEKGGLPSDAGGLLNYLGTLLPSLFGALAGLIGSTIGGLTGGDQFIGVSPDLFIAVGGGLSGFLQGAIPSLIGLINAVLATQNPNPFPNGLPFTLGVVGQGVSTTFGTAPATSTYRVDYGWNIS